MIRRVLLAATAFLSGTAVASAQTTTAAAATTTDSGPSLLWVWGWILVAGIAVFIIGTSMGVRRR